MPDHPLVCLITPNHICTNPRLVKEAKALEKAGYRVHIVFSQESRSSAVADQSILDKHPNWQYSKLDWTGTTTHSKWIRLRDGALQKLARVVTRRYLLPYWCFRVTNRNFPWQLRAAVRVDAKLYIAHNLGALPVAKLAARKRNTLAGFDAEDFHRQETEDDPKSWTVRIRTCVEDAGLKSIHHFTAASPLIGLAYQTLYPALQPEIILNVFPRVAVPPVSNGEGPLRLFWFSQTIGPDRGLEAVIEAIGKSGINRFEVHLVGNLYESFRVELQTLCALHGVDFSSLVLYGTVAEDTIFEIAQQCDIGLATETGKPYNRDICLTNKIFTYIQSGLAVVGSDTSAQSQLLQHYPQIGRLYRREQVSELAEALRFFNQHRDALNACKEANYRLGQVELNWEKESEKFIAAIEKVVKPGPVL